MICSALGHNLYCGEAEEPICVSHDIHCVVTGARPAFIKRGSSPRKIPAFLLALCPISQTFKFFEYLSPAKQRYANQSPPKFQVTRDPA